MSEIARVEFTTEQTELLRRTLCKDATNDELSLFLIQCNRTGLDPFARQIHAVKRRDRLTIQVGIDGFRLIAVRTGQLDGQDGPYWCGTDGIWRDVWTDPKPPTAAKVVVYRKGCAHGFAGVARFTEYVQYARDGNITEIWLRMAANQVAKCAEALALRKGFPQELSGLYAPEELAQADPVDTDDDDEPKPQPKPEPPKPPPKPSEPAKPEPSKPTPQPTPQPVGGPTGGVAELVYRLNSAATFDALNALREEIRANWKQFDEGEREQLISAKETRKYQLTKAAQAEGEQSPDPSTTLAPSAAPTDTTAVPVTPTSSAVPSTAPATEPEPAALVMPAAEHRTEPPRAETPMNFAGGNLAGRILALLTEHETNIDWCQIRDDKLDAALKASDAGGLAKACGYQPSPTLKVAEFVANTPSAALRLYEALQRLANRREATREKRQGGKKAGVA